MVLTCAVVGGAGLAVAAAALCTREDILAAAIRIEPHLYKSLPYESRSWKITRVVIDAAPGDDHLMDHIPADHLPLLEDILYGQMMNTQGQHYFNIKSPRLAEILVDYKPSLRVKVAPSIWTSKMKQQAMRDFLASNDLNDMEGAVMTGAEFNELISEVAIRHAPPRKFIKLTNAQELHYMHQFRDGLNVDSVPFDPDCGGCCAGGFYFAEESKKDHAVVIGGTYWSREVIVPDDAVVQIEKNKIKATRVELGLRQLIPQEERSCPYTRYRPCPYCDDHYSRRWSCPHCRLGRRIRC